MRIGVVGRPHGVRGALKVHLDNPDSDTLAKGVAIRFERGGVFVDDTIATYGSGIATFVKVPDRNVAETYVGSILHAPRAAFAEDDDSFFLVDMIGRAVVDGGGKALGVISAFTDNTAQPVAIIATPDGREVLVPFVPPIVVDVDGEAVVLAPPLGLFELDDEEKPS